MSRERARRREQRVAAQSAARAVRERRRLRRERRRSALGRLVPKRPDRRTGRLFARRTRGQRAAIGGGLFASLLLVWLYAGSVATKFALSLFILAATPVLVVLTLDRRI